MQAAPLQTKVVEVWRRLLGEENPKTITAMNNLGLMYQALGQYSQAEPLYVKVVDLIRRVLGDEHPNTLTATANLAELPEAGQVCEGGTALCESTGCGTSGTRRAEPQHAVDDEKIGGPTGMKASTRRRVALRQRHGKPASSARK